MQIIIILILKLIDKIMSTSLWKKAFSSEAEITKEEIISILFVFKQVIGVVIGVALGMTSLQGMVAMLTYAGVSFVISYIYVMKVLQPEEETIEPSDIFKEHWMLGFFNFLLFWVISYNVVNF